MCMLLLNECVHRSRSSLSDFTALVLDKLQSLNNNIDAMVRLRRNLEFSPFLSDVQRYTNKGYFLDAMIIHALQLDTQPSTGRTLCIALSVQNRVVRDCGLDLQGAIQQLQTHLNAVEFIFSKDDISSESEKYQIFTYRLYGRVLALFSRHHPATFVQIKAFWQYLLDPKNIQSLSKMNKNAAQSPVQRKEKAVANKHCIGKMSSKKRQARADQNKESLAEMSPEKRQARVDQNKESLAEMSPEKRQARAEQKRKHEDKMRAERNVKRKLHVRQVTQSREEQINEFRREFTDDELRTMSQSTIPEPNYFHNAQANPNKTLALFWINSGHCFFNSVAGRIPHSSAVPAMTLKGWYEDANLQAKVLLLLDPLDSDDEESDELAQAKQGLTVPARLELEALHGDGVPEVAYGLLDLLRSTDLPDAADHDDAMLVFCQSELFNEQCDAVCERILDQLEVHIKMADESEMPDVRTVLEAALPDQVRGWLHLMREQDLGPELGALLNEIREQKVTKELLEVRLNAFKQRIHMEALLPSCCCCGIRDDYILEKDIECVVDRASVRRSSRATTASDKRVDASAAAVPRDLYAERGPPKSSYVRVSFSAVFLLFACIEISLCAGAPEPQIVANAPAHAGRRGRAPSEHSGSLLLCVRRRAAWAIKRLLLPQSGPGGHCWRGWSDCFTVPIVLHVFEAQETAQVQRKGRV